jgi:hypothetical protein
MLTFPCFMDEPWRARLAASLLRLLIPRLVMPADVSAQAQSRFQAYARSAKLTVSSTRQSHYPCQAVVGAGRSAVVSRIWVVALGGVALAASCTSGPGPAPGAGGPAATTAPVPAGSAGRACTADGCISLSRLASSIEAQLTGKVVGYVALIGTSKSVSSGLARTAADPPKLAMGPDVMVNVASVGKMFTTIAVLKSLARRHLSTGSRTSHTRPVDFPSGV